MKVFDRLARASSFTRVTRSHWRRRGASQSVGSTSSSVAAPPCRFPPPHPRNQAPSAERTPPPSPFAPPFPSPPSTPAASTPPSRAAPPPPPPGSPTCARLDSSTRADTTVRVDRRHSSRSTPPIVSGTAAVIVTSTNRRVWSGWWPSLTSRALDALSWGGDWRAVGLDPTEAPTLTTFPTRVSTASTTDLGGRLGGAKVIGW